MGKPSLVACAVLLVTWASSDGTIPSLVATSWAEMIKSTQTLSPLSFASISTIPSRQMSVRVEKKTVPSSEQSWVSGSSCISCNSPETANPHQFVTAPRVKPLLPRSVLSAVALVIKLHPVFISTRSRSHESNQDCPAIEIT